MTFPANCLRGIRREKDLTPEGISFNVYMPDDRTAENRPDGGSEISVNWEDDNTVLALTFRGYQWGAARLPLAAIDYLNAQPGSTNALKRERAPLPDNPYHGNLVFLATLSKPAKKMIAGALALASTVISPEK